MPGHKTCIVIVGPTASGKTDLALHLATHFNTSIVSADSRQCYRELHIGVAKPSPEDLKKIRHYFIDSHSIEQEVNAGVFETYALDAVAEIFAGTNVAVMAGGTGLYIKAFCNGIDNMPGINEDTRTYLRKEYEQKGLDWLQQMIKEQDPLFYEKGEIKNPQRMLRALEVKLSIGKSILELHSSPEVKRNFNIIKIGIQLPREEVYTNINGRVDAMMQKGLLDEVKHLYEYRDLNALQTVGYTELFSHLDGNFTLEKAVAEIKKNTRHYAKRQLTWFRRDEETEWFSPLDKTGILHYLHDKITEEIIK